MTNFDERIRDALHGDRAAAPDPDRVAADVRRRRARRDTVHRMQVAGLAVVVLVATIGGFAALQRAFNGDTGTAPGTPSPSVSPSGDLGLGFSVCRVTSMPITTAAGDGTAWVFTRVTEAGCPQRGDGFSGVAVDVDGDGLADASAGPLEDCFFACEVFAAPDLDGDGISEIAVSTAGADGYGVWLYWLTQDHPQIVPIVVRDHESIGYEPEGPLEIAWVGAAAHAESARCEDGSLVISSASMGQDDADVRETILTVEGAVATVVDARHERVPFEEAPLAGDEFCGAPLQGSAAGFPGEPEPAGKDIGLGFDVCVLAKESGLTVLPGETATVWAVAQLIEDRCADVGTAEASPLIAIDLDGDGAADASAEMPCPFGCDPTPSGTTDLDGDGVHEILVNVQPFSIMDYQVFVVTPGQGLTVATVGGDGHVENGFDPGSAAVFSSGGDEGNSESVRCEGWPGADARIIQTTSFRPVDSDAPAEVHVTTLRLRGDTFIVLDRNDFESEDPGDPQGFDPACGYDWYPFDG